MSQVTIKEFLDMLSKEYQYILEYNNLRQNFIGIPIRVREGFIPKHYAKADGSFISFEDWPEFKSRYDSGLLKDMCINVDDENPDLTKYQIDGEDTSGVYLPLMQNDEETICIYLGLPNKED